jgi:hypothetical protein
VLLDGKVGARADSQPIKRDGSTKEHDLKKQPGSMK